MTTCPVRLHRNGRYWLARWRDSEGRERSRSLGPMSKLSKRGAEKKCWEIAASFVEEPARRDARGAPSLAAWREQYAEIRDDIKETTLALHDRTLRYMEAFWGAATKLDRITPARADDWRIWLGKQPGPDGTLSAQTVAAHIRNAKTIMARAKRRRLIGANPFDELSGSAPKVSKDWREITRDDLARIIDACPSGSWRCLFALCRLAGLRRGEAIRLGWGDIDWTARRLRVWPEDGEGTKQRAREVPIAPDLLEILVAAHEDAPAGSSGPCRELRSADLHRRGVGILKRAGVGRVSKPYHTLRKACENEWIKLAPWPTVCSWLGHSAKVAAEHYLRPGDDDYERVTGSKDEKAHREDGVGVDLGGEC